MKQSASIMLVVAAAALLSACAAGPISVPVVPPAAFAAAEKASAVVLDITCTAVDGTERGESESWRLTDYAVILRVDRVVKGGFEPLELRFTERVQRLHVRGGILPGFVPYFFTKGQTCRLFLQGVTHSFWHGTRYVDLMAGDLKAKARWDRAQGK